MDKSQHKVSFSTVGRGLCQLFIATLRFVLFYFILTNLLFFLNVFNKTTYTFNLNSPKRQIIVSIFIIRMNLLKEYDGKML